MEMTVLIVEDFPDIRRMMKIVLTMYGYRVIEAADGYEALQKAIEFQPDLILMDLALPLLDGLKTTEYIRAEKDLFSVPILAVTAYGDIYKDKALEAGCNAVISKPVDFKNLRTVVDHYLNN
ncbi:MAG TPA: response regulator [Pyrinomonadaceae bacterium]|nr:response regulator [Pyrinomonadaceae bacterium]